MQIGELRVRLLRRRRRSLLSARRSGGRGQDRHLVDHRRPRASSTRPPSPSSATRSPSCGPRGHQVVVGELGGHRRRAARPRPGRRRRPATPSRCRRCRPSARAGSCASTNAALAAHGLVAGQVLLAPLDFMDRRQYLQARGTLAAAARARRGAGGQRERRHRRRRDPLRRQRPARRPGRAPRRAPTCWCCSPTPPGCSPPTRGSTPAPRSSRRSSRSTSCSSGRAGGAGSARGSGGMASKLAAASIAAWSGVRAVIAAAGRARRAAPTRCAGEPASAPWCRPTTGGCRPASSGSPSPCGSRGTVVVDDGARRALLEAAARRCCRPASSGQRRASTPATPSRWPAPTASCSPRAWCRSTPPTCADDRRPPHRRPARRACRQRSSTATTSWSSPTKPTPRPPTSRSQRRKPCSHAPTTQCTRRWRRRIRRVERTCSGQLGLGSGARAGRRLGAARRGLGRPASAPSVAAVARLGGARPSCGPDLGEAGLGLDVHRWPARSRACGPRPTRRCSSAMPLALA